MSKICIGVKYCGGCNPRYDRTAFLEKIKHLCPEISFFSAAASKEFDAYLIINGCPSACANIKNLLPGKEMIFICGGEAEKTAERLKMIIEKYK